MRSTIEKNGRDGEIRTRDPLNPIHNPRTSQPPQFQLAGSEPLDCAATPSCEEGAFSPFLMITVPSESFGYGYMWWVWGGPTAVGAYRGAYTARGAFGQFITVLPELDLVIAHKTDRDPATHPGVGNWIRFRLLGQRPFVAWDRYQAVPDGLVAARAQR